MVDSLDLRAKFANLAGIPPPKNDREGKPSQVAKKQDGLESLGKQTSSLRARRGS